jgi:hypothetical protein
LFFILFLMTGFSFTMAHAQTSGDLDENEPGDCETGGLANTGCPYWDVKVVYEASLAGPTASVTCQTGGEFKCKE